MKNFLASFGQRQEINCAEMMLEHGIMQYLVVNLESSSPSLAAHVEGFLQVLI
jgi:hypothetical protein